MNLTKFDGRTVSDNDSDALLSTQPKTLLRIVGGEHVCTVQQIVSQAFPGAAREHLYSGLQTPKQIALLMQRRTATVRILRLTGSSSCRPIGLIVTEGNRDYAEVRIHCIAILPEFEGLGLASRMVRYVVKTAEQSLVERDSIFAYVPFSLPKRHRAARLLHNYGFQYEPIGNRVLKFSFDCKASPRDLEFADGAKIGKNRMAQYFADV